MNIYHKQAYLLAPKYILKDCLRQGIITKDEYNTIMSRRKQLEEALNLEEGHLDSINLDTMRDDLYKLNLLLEEKEIITDIQKEELKQKLIKSNDDEEIRRSILVINTLESNNEKGIKGR